MKKVMILVSMVFFIAAIMTTCSSEKSKTNTQIIDENSEGGKEKNKMDTVNHLPSELVEIPKDYYSKSDEQGTLVNLYYDTYESMTYEEKSKVLNKRAIVYLPAGYSEEKQYNVFYLMHGG